MSIDGMLVGKRETKKRLRLRPQVVKQILWICVGCLLLTMAHADTTDSEDEDSDVRVLYVQKTRFGDVSLVSIDAMPADTIMFNGKKVFEDPGMHVGIEGNYQVIDFDVILVSSNPGGSATPASHISFLVIKKDGSTQVLSDPDFVEAFDGSTHVVMSKDKRIYVRLGFPIEFGPTRGKIEPVAVFDSGKLAMIHLPRVHGDYLPGSAKSLENYFSDDKWIAVRNSYQDSANSQRIEYFCDDKEIMERDPELYSATSKSHDQCAAALFTKQAGRWMFQEQFEMPYGGVVKEFKNQRLVVESTEYSDEDDFGNPTGTVKLVFDTSGGKLTATTGDGAH